LKHLARGKRKSKRCPLGRGDGGFLLQYRLRFDVGSTRHPNSRRGASRGAKSLGVGGPGGPESRASGLSYPPRRPVFRGAFVFPVLPRPRARARRAPNAVLPLAPPLQELSCPLRERG